MKISKNLFQIVCMLACIFLAACKPNAPEPIIKPPVEVEPPIAETKKFIIFDVLSYKNKPNLVPEKISKMEILYEGHLTKKDPSTGKVVLDMDKITTFAESAAVKGAKVINTDIEDWFGDQTVSGTEMNSRYKTMFDVFRSKIKDVQIANYGLPMSNLMLRRYKPVGNEEAILAEWRKVNERRWEASASGDYYCPSAYIGVPGVEAWAKDLKIMVDEMKAKGVAGRKIYVFLWPQYYNFADSPNNRKFIPAADWKKMLEAAYEVCDGVMLWSSTTDENDATVDWSDSRVQAMFGATKEFIAEHNANIEVKDFSETDGGGEPVAKTEFRLFHNITFAGTPDLSSYKVRKINYAQEAALSGAADADGILTPDVAKIEALATAALAAPNTPVLVNNSTWIKDRTSNTEAMVARFKLVYDTFKGKNTTTPLLFFGVGPTNISGLRLTEGRTEEQILDSWSRYAAQPMRGLRPYADILVPAVNLIDDNMEIWKGDFNKVLNEANVDKPADKKIYAYVWTNYFNRKDTYPFFADAYKPIKEATWLEMLETIYKRCDGVIIVSNAPSADPVTWSDDLGLWKATKTFLENHKDVIK